MDAIRARGGELRATLAALRDAECASLLEAGRFEVVPYERDGSGRVLAYADSRAGRAETRAVHDPRIVRIYDAPERDAWLRVELPRDQHPELYALRMEQLWLELVSAGAAVDGVTSAMVGARTALGVDTSAR